MEALVIDAGSHIKLLSLKQLNLLGLASFSAISSILKNRAAIFLSSLESLVTMSYKKYLLIRVSNSSCEAIIDECLVAYYRPLLLCSGLEEFDSESCVQNSNGTRKFFIRLFLLRFQPCLNGDPKILMLINFSPEPASVKESLRASTGEGRERQHSRGLESRSKYEEFLNTANSKNRPLQQLEKPVAFVLQPFPRFVGFLGEDASKEPVVMVCDVLTVLKATKSFFYDNAKEYVGYIGSCDNNLCALHKSLSDVCNKKDDIKKKVKEGNDQLEEITREAASWLKDVRILTEDEELKGLMYKDIETAKFVVKMMGSKYLKRRIREETEMQQLVLKVMKKLKEDVDKSEEEMRKILEDDYKQVAEVVVEVMKDTIDEFKKLMKEDRKMAIIAIRMLKDSDLNKLTKGDKEMEEIVREAWYSSEEELWPNHEHDESNVRQPLLVKIPEMGVSENMVKEAAKKLLTPLAYLLTPLGKLMDDDDFKAAVPHAVDVKLGLEVIDGLLIRGCGSKKEMDDITKQHRSCYCSPFTLCCNYHDRYLISKAAESMVKYIQNDLISKCPQDPVTLFIRPQNLTPIPSQFLQGLDSRTQLLHQILEKLIDDQVDSVGVFGMGGIGKTTLAKEVTNRVKDTFTVKVMVEVSSAPDIVRIQAAIAESVDLPLHDVSNVGQRAIRLYNRLISEKDKKILIILDNVWKKLNLDEIGIPDTCKLLFTTRDREVCRVMNVRDVNILKVGVMNTNEARELFKSQAGKQADLRLYKNLVEKLLSKCGGLPLAIVATANSLKDKNLSSWVKFADDLEKPISSQMSGDYHDTFTILNTSYKFIQPDGKRIFFLLVCLSPLGSSVSIESLMRYGMGLNLFEHVNNLSEAMEQAVTWANELMLASMLLEGDVKEDVKIHDIVRDYAISHAAREEEHKFMVEAIPRWLDDETLNKYTAMSLTSKNDYSRLSGVEACKLQILILKGDLSPNFDDYFFNGMLNLRVLVVSSMNFQPSLPESMRKLKKLRTLYMESCKLGNFELVGELVNLHVLSLRGSSMENIPNEIGNLRKLRLLDLGGCTSSKLPLIPTSVLNKLSTLEGLYMYNERQSVLTKSENEEAYAIENIRLTFLSALEIKVEDKEELPFDGQTIKNLDKFKITLGTGGFSGGDLQNFCRSLYLVFNYDVSRFIKLDSLKVLFKKADYVEMLDSTNFETVVPQLDQEGFSSLRSLHLDWCDDIKCIVDGRTMNNMIVFPCLQLLKLETLMCLEKVCNGDVSPGSFSNLQTIELYQLNELQYGLPLVPRNLKEIQVSSCKKLKFIFIEDEEVLGTELPFLKTLELNFLASLVSLVGPKEFSNSYDALPGPRVFFGEKIGLPSLELFKLGYCEDVGKLWSKEIHTPAFQNLKEIEISGCPNLSSVGSTSVFSNLVQLENLRIASSDEMHEVISDEEIGASEIGEQSIVFPQLKSLEICLMKNLQSFYGGRSKLEFPKLKTLNLDNLESMKMFAKLENSSAFFHEKIDFPSLEKLKVKSVYDGVTGLWDKQSLTTTSNPAPRLSQLELGSSVLLEEVEQRTLAGLQHIPNIVLENLSSLTLDGFYFPDGEAVFSSSNLGERGGFVWINSQLPNLEELKVEASESLKELFQKEEYNALTSFCEQVKTLKLRRLPSLNLIPLHLFKSIASLTLFKLKWNYLISAHVLEDSLQQLQFLSIENCPNMEALVINVGSEINLPSLKELCLRYLDSFIGISSMPKNEAAFLLPSLESLEIYGCHKLEHLWQGSIFAPRLEDLTLYDCKNLQHFLVGNLEDTIELSSLRKVFFRSCRNLESISTGSLTAPKLREVQLTSCDKMECLFPGNQNHDGDLQLPSLEVVDIDHCPNLHAFSLGRLEAPKLTQIEYWEKEYSMLPYDDLNHFLKEKYPIYVEEVGDCDGDILVSYISSLLKQQPQSSHSG
ncbi:uncharacterized protein LOC141587677 [Silene latifolia]|uniref:uncharacterized protein LOC141587677 n=1 Tax=Silene latifolia TaxID=37657 RepID=UPI003D773655